MSEAVGLGIDVGGTGSRWVACDSSGSTVARGHAGGASARVFDPAEHARLSSVVRRIADDMAALGLVANSVVIGLTGFGPSESEHLRALLSGSLGTASESIDTMDDIALAYLGRYAPGEGHLISAGTGSFGIHIARGGARVRVGGRGTLIDDGGSGAWIALQALDLIYRATAIAILQQAGRELARLAHALLQRVGPLPLTFVGGALSLHPAVQREVSISLNGQQVEFAQADLAAAAARIAVQRHWATLPGGN